jgi:hypothetical protein
MKKLHLDVYIGLVLLAASGYFYFLAHGMPADPALFPKLILVILMALSCVICGTGVLETVRARHESRPVKQHFPALKGPATVFIALCVYAALIEVLGFFAASTAASAFFMVLFGLRSYVRILLVLVGINAFIYALFVWQLKITLPAGLLI